MVQPSAGPWSTCADGDFALDNVNNGSGDYRNIQLIIIIHMHNA